MKKIFLSLLTFSALSASAQRILVGDMNGDGVLSIEDVTLLTSTILGERDAKYHICVNEQHEYVDLGLPSGTLWATCNVGANSPEEYGDYFAWGEVDPKNTYSWSTYKYCNGSYRFMTKYCFDNFYGIMDGEDELFLEDDAAYMNWGEGWIMPSRAQLEELYEICSYSWTTHENVNGRKFVGPNGNSLFLPAAGNRIEDSLYGDGTSGYYWSRSVDKFWSADSYRLGFGANYFDRNCNNRCYGYSIRPVRVSSQIQVLVQQSFIK